MYFNFEFCYGENFNSIVLGEFLKGRNIELIDFDILKINKVKLVYLILIDFWIYYYLCI